LSIVKHVTLQKIVTHDFRYDPRKFEKLVDLVGFIIRIHHTARSPELHIHVSESHHQEDSEEVRKVIDALRVADQNGGSPGCESTEAERKAALTQLIRLVRETSALAVMENFK